MLGTLLFAQPVADFYLSGLMLPFSSQDRDQLPLNRFRSVAQLLRQRYPAFSKSSDDGTAKMLPGK